MPPYDQTGVGGKIAVQFLGRSARGDAIQRQRAPGAPGQGAMTRRHGDGGQWQRIDEARERVRIQVRELRRGGASAPSGAAAPDAKKRPGTAAPARGQCGLLDESAASGYQPPPLDRLARVLRRPTEPPHHAEAAPDSRFRVKSNMLLIGFAIVSNEPCPMRLPPSQLSSTKRRIEV